MHLSRQVGKHATHNADLCRERKVGVAKALVSVQTSLNKINHSGQTSLQTPPRCRKALHIHVRPFLEGMQSTRAHTMACPCRKWFPLPLLSPLNFLTRSSLRVQSISPINGHVLHMVYKTWKFNSSKISMKLDSKPSQAFHLPLSPTFTFLCSGGWCKVN